MSRHIGLLDIHQRQADQPARFLKRKLVECLIARSLAEWIVRGVIAREITPKPVQNGWVTLGTYKSLQELSSYAAAHEPSSLPLAELPGLKFVEPTKRRREPLPCALMESV